LRIFFICFGSLVAGTLDNHGVIGGDLLPDCRRLASEIS